MTNTIAKEQIAWDPKIITEKVNAVNYKRIAAFTFFYILIFIVVVIKILALEWVNEQYLFFAYSLTVASYVLSRFALAYFYTPTETKFDTSYEPTVSFAVPSKNEGEHIKETIMRMVYCNYPKDKFDIIAINDGSTDNTLQEMREAK